MGKRLVVESGRDRRALVADAGWSQVSVVSVLAGVLVAYGAFALLAGIASGILEATGADTDIRVRWDDLGVAAGLVVAALLLLSYLFGGYVAGRMARRAGLLHGIAVFVLGVLVAAVVAVLVRQLADTDAVVESLRDLGLPTTGDEWADVGTVAGLASLAGALVGAVLGGLLGERWHATLLSRAVDPDVGAEAEARRAAEVAAVEARVRHTESQERADTASLRRVRTPAPDRRPDDAPARSGWYRDRGLDDVDRTDDRDTLRRTDDRDAVAGTDDRSRAWRTDDEPDRPAGPAVTGAPGLHREPAVDTTGTRDEARDEARDEEGPVQRVARRISRDR